MPDISDRRKIKRSDDRIGKVPVWEITGIEDSWLIDDETFGAVRLGENYFRFRR